MKNLLLFILLFPALAFGQDSVSYVPLARTPPPVVIQRSPVFKLAPLSLIDIDPTLQAAVEIPLRPNWSIQQEVGYGWPTLGLFNYQRDLVKPKTTFRARTEIRYYFSPDFRQQAGLKQGPGGFYVAAEGLYKQMGLKLDRTVPGITVWPALPAKETVRINRHVYGLHAKIGYQAIVGGSGKTPQFVVDVYVGVGFRIVSVRQAGGSSVITANSALSEGLLFSRFVPFDSALRKPSMAAGIKIGWLINSGRKVRRR
jgi:hypothetical protein